MVSEKDEQEAQFRGYEQLFEQMPSAFALHELILDANGRPYDYRFEYVNPAFLSHTGLQGTVIGKTIREITPEIEDTWIQQYGEVVLTGKSRSWDQYSRELKRYYRVHAYRPFNGFFAVLFDDVTDKVQQGRRLEKHEAKLSKAIQVGKLGLFEYSFLTGDLSADPTWYAITGLSGSLENAELREAFIERVAPEKRKLVRSFLSPDGKDLASESDENEFRFQHPSRGMIWLRIFSQVFSSKEGEHLIGYIRDITMRKVTEDGLKVSNSRLQALVEISEYDVTDFLEFLNYSLEKAIAFTHSEYGYFYFYDEDKQEFQLNAWSSNAMDLCRVQEPETVYALEKTGLWGEVVRQRKAVVVNDYNMSTPKAKGLPEGHVGISRWMSVPIFSEGRIVAVAGVANKATDYDQPDKDQFSLMMHSVWKIAESYNSKQQLIIQKNKAEQAAKAKADFLANMSHEIRTPMNAIIGLLHLLKKKNLPREVIGYLNKIETSSSTLLDIINDVLDFSKIEANKIVLEQSPFRPADVLSQVGDIFNILASEKGLLLRVQYVPGIPEVLIGDQLRLRQVLTNLLSNALKFTREGEIILRAELESLTDESAVVSFSVKDSGIGMTPSQMEKIFDSFIQADASTTRNFGGTGLGLSISQHYVQMMGGVICVDSEPGVGSSFSFSLKFTRHKETTSTDVRSLDFLAEPPDLTGLTILLVEDNALNRDVAEGLLEDTFAQVFSAENGAESVEMVMSQKLDLILMDVHMPEMDGMEATRKIREWERANGKQPLPIIAMTASAFTEDRNRCLEAGMTAYLSKPIEPAELYSVLNTYKLV